MIIKLIKTYKNYIVFVSVGAILAVGGYVAALNGFFGGGAAIPSDTMTRGLVGYWNMDESGGQTAKDLSNNGNNGTLTNGPVWTKGKNGGGLGFDGVDDYVFKSDSTSLSITGDLTIESWIKLNAISKEQTIIGKWDETTANADRSYRLWIDSSNKLNLSVTTDGSTVVSHTGSTTTFAANEWYHIAGIYNNSGTPDVMDLYVNGVLDVTQKTTGVPVSIDDNISNLYIGAKENTSGSNDTLFNGIIDEPRVYNRALSAEEVRYHYNRGGPVAEWKFEEGSGSTANDATENNNNITLVATPSWVSGKYGSALDLESTSSQYGYKADTASLSITKDLTLSVWIKPESVTAATLFDIAGKWDYISSTAVESYLLAQYGDEIRLYIDAAANYKTTDSANLIAGNWYHIEGVYNAAASTVNIYVNGILQAGTVAGTIPSSIADDAARFHIGAEDSSTAAANFYDGLIDSVRVYNYARAQDEILLDYSAGFAAKFGGDPLSPAERISLGLAGYWNFEEGGASTAKDSSGNGKNGTLTNGPLWTKGKKGNAIKFDGVNDYVTSNFQFSIFNFQSISNWINFQTLAAGKPIIGKWGGNQNAILLKTDDTNSDELKICVASDLITDDCANYGITTDANIAANVWYNIQIVYDGTQSTDANKLKLYFNGVQKTLTITGTIPTTLQNSTGALEIGGDSDLAVYAGAKIDEVRVYNRALSFEEVNYLYNEKKPVGQWDFDEGAGATAHDSQGNLNITFPASVDERPTWTKP
ncbi:MAG: LamG domain-containing protein [Patescibacteria group bacterium]